MNNNVFKAEVSRFLVGYKASRGGVEYSLGYGCSPTISRYAHVTFRICGVRPFTLYIKEYLDGLLVFEKDPASAELPVFRGHSFYAHLGEGRQKVFNRGLTYYISTMELVDHLTGDEADCCPF